MLPPTENNWIQLLIGSWVMYHCLIKQVYLIEFFFTKTFWNWTLFCKSKLIDFVYICLERNYQSLLLGVPLVQRINILMFFYILVVWPDIVQNITIDINNDNMEVNISWNYPDSSGSCETIEYFIIQWGYISYLKNLPQFQKPQLEEEGRIIVPGVSSFFMTGYMSTLF